MQCSSCVCLFGGSRRCCLSPSPFQDVALFLHILMGPNSALNVSNFAFPCSISGHQQFSFAILCCSTFLSLSRFFKLRDVSFISVCVCLCSSYFCRSTRSAVPCLWRLDCLTECWRRMVASVTECASTWVSVRPAPSISHNKCHRML
jgi:hypothetical protein